MLSDNTGAHCSSVVDRMAFIKGIASSKEEADDPSHRESITSKLQELEETILDVEDVTAMKTIEFNLGKVYEVLSGHAKKRVAVEENKPSHKPWSGAQSASETSPGGSVSGDASVGKPKFLEDMYTIPDNILAEYEYKPSRDV